MPKNHALFRVGSNSSVGSFFGCNKPNGQEKPHVIGYQDEIVASNYHTVLAQREKTYAERQTNNLGKLLASIPFEVRTDNKKEFENGVIPWTVIESPEEDIPHLIDGNKIVVPKGKATLIIDYPLTNRFYIDLESRKGLTRVQILRSVSKAYYKLYQEEEQTATVKTIPINERITTYNRNQTDGKYGIWGHDIADLVLAEVLLYRTSDGRIILSLNMQS
ncbi:hypothetical protein [Hymenobacter sp. B1770]|uniref:hypothetical protein n=1 Tax=Hymenobacter sp. B1770 TaxID=1718788 RepID=UPI003CF071EF